MKIDKFKVEYWLNPLDPVSRYNLGSSCCKPFTVEEMLEFTGTDPKEFYDEINSMSLHYGYFEGMPRLKKAIANLYTDVVTEDMVLTVHGGTGECDGGRVLLKPAPDGTGLIVGGGMRPVLEAAGIRDAVGKSLGSKNRLNVVKATMDALSQLRSAEEIAALRA